jgi:hypothetical protein
MRRGALTLVRAGLLAGPGVLAFFSGGFFDGARLVAAIAAWVLLGIAAVAVPGSPLPRGGAPRLAVGGLAGLAAWTWLSRDWAPRLGPAEDAAQLALLYLPVLAVAAIVFRPRAAARAVEPALALGTLVVVGYGLAGRLLPGIVHLQASLRAGGRLEQPLTYWNAMGALAALGVVLCARLAGDATRSRALRVGAAAAAGPLGMGAYLSFSRGALACLVAGVAALVLLAPTWRQLHAALVALEVAAVGAIVAAPFDGVRALAPSPSAGQGAIVLVLLLGAMGAAALVHRAVCRAEARGALRAGPLPLGGRRRMPAIAVVVVIAAAPYALALASGGDGSSGAFGASSSRLSDVGSHRSAYWRVAVQTWADHPLAGAGAGSFGTEWLARRHIDERVEDAHSLYLQTPAELGLVGLALLLALLGGVVAAARAAVRADRVLAAGPAAALFAWALHAGLDWDWEMPALTLVAVVLAGVLLGGREPATADGARDLGDEPALEGDAESRRDDAEQHELGDRLHLGAR